MLWQFRPSNCIAASVCTSLSPALRDTMSVQPELVLASCSPKIDATHIYHSSMSEQSDSQAPGEKNVSWSDFDLNYLIR